MPAAATNVGSGTLRTLHPMLLVGGLVIVVLGLIFAAGSDETLIRIEIQAGLVAIVAGFICGFILLYRTCRCVTNGIARFELREKWLDPGSAVALCAIPIVNLIGGFVVLGPLPGHLNRLARAAGTRADAPRELGYAIALTAVFTIVPGVGRLFALIAAVMFPILILRCSKVADAIDAAIATAATPAPSPAP